MSKKKDKMFMGVAGLSLVALMAMTMSGCAPQQAPSNETDDSSTTVVVEENQNAADDAARTAEEELSNPLPLEVVDFGWFPSENNMVDFSVAVNNPNQYVSADDITLTVNGLDEAGNVFFTQDISLAAIAPNSDYVFSYVVGDTSDNPKAPHDIAITANVAEGGWSVYNESEEVSFTVDDVAVAPSDIEGVDMFTGNVSAKNATVQDPDGQGVEGQAMVNVVLYDDNGKMEGGYFDVIDLNGQDKVPFKVYAIDAPEYKDYKVFVSPFSFDYSDEEDVQTVQ